VSASRRVGVSWGRRVGVSACRRVGVSACRRVDVSAKVSRRCRSNPLRLLSPLRPLVPAQPEQSRWAKASRWAIPGSRLSNPKAFGGCLPIELPAYKAAPLQASGLRRQLLQHFRQEAGTAGNGFDGCKFIRTMTFPVPARDKDHGAWTDLRHEQRVMVCAANHPERRKP